MRYLCKVVGLVFVLLPFCLLVEAPVLASLIPPEENIWVEIPPMPHARSYFNAVVVDGKIYAIGGLDERGVTNTVERYDPQTGRWTELQPMPTRRYSIIVVCSMDKIYCIGGAYQISPSHYITTNEVYDPATNQWEKKTPIPIALSGASACVVNGSIYVMGGLNTRNSSWMPFEDCIVYDPAEDTWSVYNATWPEVPSTNMVFENKGYIVEDSTLKIHDLERDRWMDGPDLPRILLQGRAIVEADGLLYALGGCTETYSYLFDVWRSAIPDRVHFSSAFVYTPFGYGRIPPVVSVLSLEDIGEQAFGNVSLIFGVNRSVDWMGYSLDNQANVTIEGNVTLSGLSSGWHNITVFAKDEYGNVGTSETTPFTVAAAPVSRPPINAIATVGVIVVTAVVVCVGLVLFLRKRSQLKPLQVDEYSYSYP